MRVALLFLVAGMAATLAAQEPPPQPTFRSKTSAVMVDATVTDRGGRPLTGLTATDFEIRDNGVAQRVHEVSYGKLPIDVTVALDVSHSVSGRLIDRLREAIVQLMGDLAKGDRLRLTLFNTRIARTMDYTTDVKAVERAVRATAAGGGTALFDAISATLVSSTAPDRRQLAVFFTDGSDSSSTTSPQLLTGVAERTRATLAFVVPSAAAPPTFTVPTVTKGMITVTPAAGTASGLRVANESLLSTLARETGGRILPVGGNANLSAAFRSILSAFRSTYVLYYTPTGVDRAGYHRLEVKVKRDGSKVEARRGYFSG